MSENVCPPSDAEAAASTEDEDAAPVERAASVGPFETASAPRASD
jgi:hypothetical protein